MRSATVARRSRSSVYPSKVVARASVSRVAMWYCAARSAAEALTRGSGRTTRTWRSRRSAAADLERVLARENERAFGLLARRPTGDCVFGQRVLDVRQQPAKIPERQDLRVRTTAGSTRTGSVRGSGRQRRGRRKPILRHVRRAAPARAGRRRERAHHLPARVRDGQRDLALRRGWQLVVDDRALGRIRGGGRFDRQRRVAVHVPSRADRRRRRQQTHIRGRGGAAELPERRDVVEDPQRAAIGCRAPGRRRGRPCRASKRPAGSAGAVRQWSTCIERHVHAALGAAVQQALARGVFAHDARECGVRQALHDRLPAWRRRPRVR